MTFFETKIGETNYIIEQ